MFSGLGPLAGAWGNRLRERSQLRETGYVCPTRFLVEVRSSRATGGTSTPWGERARKRRNAEMKKDYLPQHQDKTGGNWAVSQSLAFLILVLSVSNAGIVCDRNKLPNHLIDGWVEGCLIVPLTFP